MSYLETELSIRTVKSRLIRAGVLEVLCVFEFTPTVEFPDLFFTEAEPFAWRSCRFSHQTYIPDLALYEEWEQGLEVDVELTGSGEDRAEQLLTLRNESGLSYEDVVRRGWRQHPETLSYLDKFKVFVYRNSIFYTPASGSLVYDLSKLSVGNNPSPKSDMDYLMTLIEIFDLLSL